MGFLLSIIAYTLFLPTAFLNFFIVLYKNIRIQGFYKAMDNYWFVNAFEVDVWGNYHFRTTWNTILRKEGGYKFGKLKETISSALGKNQRDKTLSIMGWIVVGVLYAIDVKFWRKGGHCLNSINDKL